MLKDEAAIVGIGETAFSKALEPSEKSLALSAILLALEDAGIEPSEVDGLASYTLETTDEVEVARNLGAGDITFFFTGGLWGRSRTGLRGPAGHGDRFGSMSGGCRLACPQEGVRRANVGRPQSSLFDARDLDKAVGPAPASG